MEEGHTSSPSSSCDESSASGGVHHLLDLPPELFLRICHFLDAEFVLSTLPLVCKHFHAILGDDAVWKVRLQRHFPYVKFPSCLSTHSSFNFTRSCVCVEKEHSRWRQSSVKLLNSSDEVDSSGSAHLSDLPSSPPFVLSSGHYASADAVHLLHDSKLCVSGSRDRAICLWNLESLDSDHPQSPKEALLHTQEHAHSGWIWSLTSVGDTVYSGGWDCHVREWQLTNSGLEPTGGDARCEAAVLSVVAQPNFVIASSYDHRVRIFDPRELRQHVARLHYHSGPVLSVVDPLDAGEDVPYFFSSGEDQRIYCVDKRTWTVVSHRRLTRYALDLSYCARQLWASDSAGRLHLLDPFSRDLNVVSAFRVSPNKVRSVTHNLGCVMCVSADKKLRVFTPGQRLKKTAELGPFQSEATRIRYSKGTLVCAFSDQGLGVWKKV